ncbi:MAG: hypothetical protein ACXADH_06240 [Candidatus Kariarchaeaceae archaeon]|jgi:curved DNA-binding protein CbpA
MALTITSNLTEISDADTATGWGGDNLAAGAGIDTDQAWEGNGCYAAQAKSTGLSRVYFTANSSINMEDKYLRIWARFTEINKYEKTENGAIRICVEDTNNNGAEWYMAGPDAGLDEGWNLYIVKCTHNTQDRFWTTGGGISASVNMQDLYLFGVTVNMSSKPARAANIFVDAIRYGDGLTITGTPDVAGQGFKEIAEADDATANKYGIFNYDRKSGVYFLSGNLVFGDSAGTSSVNFTDSSDAKIFLPDYWGGPPPEDWGSGDKVGQWGWHMHETRGFKIVGNSTGTTKFNLGSVVGTGDERQGILGGVISSQLDGFIFDAETDTGDIDECYLYGVTFEGGSNVKLSGASTQKAIGCTFFNCDEVQSNNAEFLNNRIIAPMDRGVEITSSHDHELTTYIASGADTKRRFDHAGVNYWEGKNILNMTEFFNDESDVSTFSFFMAMENEAMAWGSRGRYTTLSVNVNSGSYNTWVWDWDYWNGSAWADLGPYILSDETINLTVNGQGELTFAIPSDWAQYAYQSSSTQNVKSRELYYVRASINWVVGDDLILNPSDSYIKNAVEAHTHFPSSGNYTINDFSYFGHASSPGHPQWHLENSAAATTEDSYAVSNQSANQTLGNGTVNGVAQSFNGGGNVLTSASFWLSRTLNPTGNITAYLYAHSGTYGTSSIPTGSALATSNTVNVEDVHITTDGRLINFEFEEGITLTSGTKYVLALEYDGGNTGNYINVGIDDSSPSHAGNLSTKSSGTWTANSSADAIFFIYTGAKVNVSADGGNPSTKWNSNNSPGATELTNSVSISIRAYDTSNSANVSGVRVYLTAASGGSLPVGTTILDPQSQTTNAAGLVVDNFNYTGNQPVSGWARQGSSSPYYKEATLSGTITSAGLSLTAPMVRDE